jgi:hypothetical protein
MIVTRRFLRLLFIAWINCVYCAQIKSNINRLGIATILGISLSCHDVKLSHAVYSSVACGGVEYPLLKKLGAGGTGSVFKSRNDRVVKISRTTTKKGTNSLQRSGLTNECNVLKHIENESMKRYGSLIKGVEQCICFTPNFDSDTDSDTNTVAIFRPYFETPIVSSTTDITSLTNRHKAENGIIDTIARLITIGIAASDLQPLYNADNGDWLLIDLSEAYILSQPLSLLDKQRVVAFITEGMNLIPSTDKSQKLARLQMKKIFEHELHLLQTNQQENQPKYKHNIIDKTINDNHNIKYPLSQSQSESQSHLLSQKYELLNFVLKTLDTMND